MVLYKNKSNQVVYTRVINVTTGAYVSGLTLTATISQNGGNFIAAGTTVTNHGNGIYSLVLTQEQTNCDTGCIFFSGVSSQQNVEAIFFQTSTEYPIVGGIRGDIGTSSVPVNMYVSNISAGTNGSTEITADINNSITDISSIVTGIKNATYSGITQDKLNNLILSFIASKAEIDPPVGDQVLIKYKYFGTNTELMRINVNFNNGERQNSGTFDYSGA